MNFLLDVHVAMRLARFLSKQGHDVVHAGIAHPMATDRELLAIAVAEQRILITEDRDFSELVFVRGEKAPPGIIYLRCEPAQQLQLIERLKINFDFERVIGNLLVVGQTGSRSRPLPVHS